MFRVLGIYNFGSWQKVQEMIVKQTFTPVANFGHQALVPNLAQHVQTRFFVN